MELTHDGSNEDSLYSMNDYMYPSLYKIGQRVRVDFGNGFASDWCVVRTITFTSGKIRYSVTTMSDPDQCEDPYDHSTTLHNIDSVYVVDGFDDFYDMPEDNYS